MTSPSDLLKEGDGVLIVDMQRCFLPVGTLPVPHGDTIIPVLNQWIDAAHRMAIPLYFSRDWHPREHPSFEEQGGKWPPHCVQDTPEAQFHPDLHVPENAVIVTKGVRFDGDQNSAFDRTGLEHRLHLDNVIRLWIGGLALDVCVKASALDARHAQIVTRLIPGGSRPVTPEGGRQALQAMQQAGVFVTEEHFAFEEEG
ncbi:MAG: isochorismatase family protein [Desulfovibrionales bacterium]